MVEVSICSGESGEEEVALFVRPEDEKKALLFLVKANDAFFVQALASTDSTISSPT